MIESKLAETWIADKDTYSMATKCTNCGWCGCIDVPKGNEFSKGDCPMCACRTLRKNL